MLQDDVKSTYLGCNTCKMTIDPRTTLCQKNPIISQHEPESNPTHTSSPCINNNNNNNNQLTHLRHRQPPQRRKIPRIQQRQPDNPPNHTRQLQEHQSIRKRARHRILRREARDGQGAGQGHEGYLRPREVHGAGYLAAFFWLWMCRYVRKS